MNQPTPQEIGAIVSAYTGVMLGHFEAIHQYAERVLGRPIFTHQFADENLCDALKEAAKPDFLRLNAWIRSGKWETK